MGVSPFNKPYIYSHHPRKLRHPGVCPQHRDDVNVPAVERNLQGAAVESGRVHAGVREEGGHYGGMAVLRG